MAFSDPLLRKELQSLARRRLTYVSRGACVAVVGVVVFHFWLSRIPEHRSFSPSEYADLGRQIFQIFVFLQTILVTLGAILTAADSMRREAEAQTLGLLFLTPLSPIQIVTSKWRAAMAQSVTLILCGLPILAICAYLGAVGILDVLRTTILTVSLAAASAALAVRQSVLRKTTSGAVFVTLLELGIVTFLPYPLVTAPEVRAVAVSIHPAFTLPFVNPRFAVTGGWEWVPAALFPLLVIFLLLPSAARRLEGVALRVAEPDPLLTENRGLLAPGAAVRSWITETAVWDRNPVLWKELATRPGARFESSIGPPLIWTTLAVTSVLALARPTQSTGFFIILIAFTLLLTTVVIQGAALFVRDRRNRQYELILCTPLSTFEILQSKLLSGVLAPEALYVNFTGLLFIAGWTLNAGILTTFLAVTATMLFLGFSYMLAALCSLHARTVRGAFLLTATILGLIAVAFPACPYWFELYRYGTAPYGRTAGNYLAQSINPLLFLDYSIAQILVWGNHLKPALLAYSLTYITGTFLLLAAIAWRFHAIRRPR